MPCSRRRVWGQARSTGTEEKDINASWLKGETKRKSLTAFSKSSCLPTRHLLWWNCWLKQIVMHCPQSSLYSHKANHTKLFTISWASWTLSHSLNLHRWLHPASLSFHIALSENSFPFLKTSLKYRKIVSDLSSHSQLLFSLAHSQSFVPDAIATVRFIIAYSLEGTVSQWLGAGFQGSTEKSAEESGAR